MAIALIQFLKQSSETVEYSLQRDAILHPTVYGADRCGNTTWILLSCSRGWTGNGMFYKDI